ncbi:hypothetical protein GALL_414500 [mine drainage metagenome]|uniref:Uncharacterized protein n=1 Tax=mine drainage metagenome TaxID=410659 RepID=A0A1J5PZH0_9ZZZZ
MCGGLVQDDHAWRLEQQAGNGKPLLLTTRKTMATVSDYGLETVRKRLDQRPNLSCSTGFYDFLVRCIRFRVPKVCRNGVVKEMGILHDHSDGIAQ